MSLSADSFQRCCRLCAEEQEVTIMLFSEEAEAMLLKKKLNKYLLIEVDEDDKLPKNICIKCCSKLQTVCEFIDKAVQAQEILHKQSLTMEQNQSCTFQQNERLTSEQQHSVALEQSVTLEPIKIFKTIKQDPDPDSDDDLKYATMEISVTSEQQHSVALEQSVTLEPIKIFKTIKQDPDPDSDDDLKYATMEISVTSEQQHSVALEQSVTLEPIKNFKTIKQEPDPDSDDDLKFATMEVSVDPMMVLQNSEDSETQLPETENSESDEEAESYLPGDDEEDVSYLHGVDGQDVTIKRIKRVKKPKSFDGKPFPCRICKRGFHTELALKNHMWVHKTKDPVTKPFKCGCGESFSHKNDFVVHLQKHNYASGMCMICGRRFRTAANLAAHMEAHTSNTGRSYTCKVCGRSYNTSSNLKTHSVTHSNERPYKCTYCKKCFKRNQDLKFHINQHTGEKPYKCPFCDKRFASSGNCYSHKSRMHPGRRTDIRKRIIVARETNPVQFRPIAPKPALPGPTTTKPVVKASLKYQCTLCEHSFLKRDNFTYHMFQHTGVKPFHCSFCSETFVTRLGLINHHDKTHPGKDRPLALISRNALLK